MEHFESKDVINKSVEMARLHGMQMIEENDNPRVNICASAIMLSTFCSSAGATEEQMIGILKSVHAITKRFDSETMQ